MTKLFGTDGIRGTNGKWPLVPDFFLDLGKALGAVIETNRINNHIAVGRDTRQSGQMLTNAFIAGVLTTGINVIDLGVIPTPGVSWLVQKLGMEAGAVISASHNPVEQNGIKFFDSSGKKLSKMVEEDIESFISSVSGGATADSRNGQYSGKLINGSSFQEVYNKSLLSEHDQLDFKDLTIVVDCSNGAASFIAPEVFAKTGADVIPINSAPTGLNINVNSGSEWARREPQEFGEIIRSHEADFGIAFDGDGDRVVFVDSRGGLIDGDHILGMLAQSLSRGNKLLSSSVVTTIMRNSGLVGFLEERGIKVYETPVGDKYVVEKLRELQVEEDNPDSLGLGGEQSGHIVILDDEHPTGDGLRTGLYVIKSFLESGLESFSLLHEYINKTPQIIGSALVGYKKRLTDADLNKLSGRVRSDNKGITRANLRYSGTEPKFRIMIEGDANMSINDLAGIANSVCVSIQQTAGTVGQPIDLLNCTSGGSLRI